MKTFILVSGLLLSFLNFSATTGFTAPVSDLDNGNSAYGIMWGTHSTTYYAETKITDTLTLGLQSTSWKKADNVNELFGQFDGANGAKMILGTRNFDAKSRCYAGLAKSNPLPFEWTTYTSALIGDGFQELQLGAKYTLTDNADLDFNYDYYRYRGSRSSLNFGLTYKVW